jgi:hypothetical protein
VAHQLDGRGFGSLEPDRRYLAWLTAVSCQVRIREEEDSGRFMKLRES